MTTGVLSRLWIAASLASAGGVMVPSLAQAQEVCQGATYEAESMFHSTGGSTPGGWNIWSDGYISATHNFDGGSKVITVIARGQSAAGVAAHMTVTAGSDLLSYPVSSANWTAYTFNVDAVAGPQEIRVTFDNDFNQGGQDRNLLIDKVIVGCGGGWTNLTLRNGWKAAAGSNVPAVGLIDGIVTFRGALDGSAATSDVPFCFTDGHTTPGPDYTQYRGSDVGYFSMRVALANGATGSLEGTLPIKQPDDTEPPESYCFQLDEHGAAAQPGPNARAFTSLEGVTFTKSRLSPTQPAALIVPGGSRPWDTEYPMRGSDSGLPAGEGIYAKVINGFVRFQGVIKFRSGDPFDPLMFTLPANQGLIPNNPVYLPVALAPLGTPQAGRIVIQPNGDVLVEGPVDNAAEGVSLDGTAYSMSAPPSALPISLSNSWVALSSRAVRARVANGVVRLEGAVKDGTTDTLGTLPSGMRPSQSIYVVANAVLFGQPATLRIDPDGTLHVVAPALVVAQPGISLDGVSFALDPFACTGACLSATPIARNQNSGPFNTLGERWFVVSDSVNGWQASEVTGRTLRVNGVPVTPGQMPLPPSSNGLYYFQFSAGTKTWASWSFW